MKPLLVNERFHTWQGEGVHLGKSAYFIRFQGCPVKCPWCDSAGTWHPDWIPPDVEKANPADLADAAAGSGCEIVVLTGGEPTIHDLADLTTELSGRGLPVHVETCGGYPFRGHFDWVTLSPKWWQLPLDENLRLADEIKIIVEDTESIAKWARELEGRYQADIVWLNPEWSQVKNPQVLESISNWVKAHGKPYRAGYQLHKVYDVDRLDPGAHPLAPLGGDPAKGC